MVGEGVGVSSLAIEFFAWQLSGTIFLIGMIIFPMPPLA